VHGDIKDVRTLSPPTSTLLIFRQANILIDDGCHVQLCDFGLALIAESAGMQTTNSSGQGTRSWMSPERLAEEDHQLAVADDIYAYACLGYYVSLLALLPRSGAELRRTLQLFALQAPFRDLRDTAIILKVCNGERPARPSSDTSTGCLLSDQIWTLVEACWSQAARDRPTISTARARLEAATASSPPSDTSQTTLSTMSLRPPALTIRPGVTFFQFSENQHSLGAQGPNQLRSRTRSRP
jgi:serine/threonine protein kinase